MRQNLVRMRVPALLLPEYIHMWMFLGAAGRRTRCCWTIDTCRILHRYLTVSVLLPLHAPRN